MGPARLRRSRIVIGTARPRLAVVTLVFVFRSETYSLSLIEQISSLALLAGSVWSTSFSGTMAASHSIMENYDSVSTHTGAHFCLRECAERSKLTKPFKGEAQPARVRWDVSRLSCAQTVQ